MKPPRSRVSRRDLLRLRRAEVKLSSSSPACDGAAPGFGSGGDLIRASRPAMGSYFEVRLAAAAPGAIGLTERALDYSFARMPSVDRALRPQLLEAYLKLDAFPDARAALTGLKTHGARLAILSNGSPRMLQELVRNSGLDRWIKAALSIDSVRAYKPHRSCYALVEPALGVPKEEILFVSSNSFDAVGAKAFGFKVAWIRRRAVEAPLEGPVGAAKMFRMLRGKAEELGHAPDHVVSALTDLPKLL